MSFFFTASWTHTRTRPCWPTFGLKRGHELLLIYSCGSTLGPSRSAIDFCPWPSRWVCFGGLDPLPAGKWFVPEEERHDSAVKRNRKALTTELKLWEDYLEKVWTTRTHTHVLTMLTAVFVSCDFCIKVAAGSYLVGAFSLADVNVFPNIAYAFRFASEFRDGWMSPDCFVFQ